MPKLPLRIRPFIGFVQSTSGSIQSWLKWQCSNLAASLGLRELYLSHNPIAEEGANYLEQVMKVIRAVLFFFLFYSGNEPPPIKKKERKKEPCLPPPCPKDIPPDRTTNFALSEPPFVMHLFV